MSVRDYPKDRLVNERLLKIDRPVLAPDGVVHLRTGDEKFVRAANRL